MGNCISFQPSHNIEEWSGVNANLDIVRYHSEVDAEYSICLQHILKNLWKSKELNFPFFTPTNIPVFNVDTYKLLRPSALYGIPNYLFRTVILKIFNFDLYNSEYNYELSRNMADPNAGDCSEFANLSKKYFLTAKGSEGVRDLYNLLCVESLQIREIVYIPTLLHLLMWFFKEHEAFGIVRIMISEVANDGQVFFNSYIEKDVYSLSKKIIEHINESELPEDITEIVAYLVRNMTTGVVSGCYFPFVLAQFLLDGVNGLARIIVSLVRMWIAAVENPKSADRESLREFCKDQLVFTDWINRSFYLHNINFIKH